MVGNLRGAIHTSLPCQRLAHIFVVWSTGQVFGEDIGNVIADGDISDVDDDAAALRFFGATEGAWLGVAGLCARNHVGAVNGGFVVDVEIEGCLLRGA